MLNQTVATIQAKWMGGIVDPTGWQAVLWHSTESGTKAGTARNIGSYFATETKKTSAHEAIDVAEAVQCVPPNRVAYHCGNGNSRTYALELCARASFSTADWLSIHSTLDLAAGRAAFRLHLMGVRTARWCTPAELRAGVRGMGTHDDARLAWGGTTHTDPGPNFPKALVLALVQADLDQLWGVDKIPGKTSTPSTTPTPVVTPAPAGDWFDDMDDDTIAMLRKIVNEEVTKVTDAQGITGAGDLGRTVSYVEPHARKWINEEATKVSESQGYAGAADFNRLADRLVPAIAVELGSRGGTSLPVSMIQDAVSAAFTTAAEAVAKSDG